MKKVIECPRPKGREPKTPQPKKKKDKIMIVLHRGSIERVLLNGKEAEWDSHDEAYEGEYDG
jgi:hypothetical protein